MLATMDHFFDSSFIWCRSVVMCVDKHVKFIIFCRENQRFIYKFTIRIQTNMGMDQLPQDVLGVILKGLDLDEGFGAKRVSKRFDHKMMELSNEDEYWLNIFRHRFDIRTNMRCRLRKIPVDEYPKLVLKQDLFLRTAADLLKRDEFNRDLQRILQIFTTSFVPRPSDGPGLPPKDHNFAIRNSRGQPDYTIFSNRKLYLSYTNLWSVDFRPPPHSRFDIPIGEKLEVRFMMITSQLFLKYDVALKNYKMIASACKCLYELSPAEKSRLKIDETIEASLQRLMKLPDKLPSMEFVFDEHPSA